MSWTDERVALLTKLWSDGLSASQVAAELGGVTRNAVIGKIHRLGLSGRDKPAAKSGARQKRATPTNNYSRPNRTGAKITKPDSNLTIVAKAEPLPSENLVAPASLCLKLVQLSETTCKWPMGDPQAADFSFCGHQIKADTPYCDYHCKLAYQPVTERRRVRKFDA